MTPLRDEPLRRLQAAHGAALLTFAMRLTGGDRAAAEDLVQETLLRAWRHGAELADDGNSPRPWLFTVARRVAIDQHRARLARPREVEHEVPETAGTDEIDAALDRLLMMDALASLSEDHRAVVIALYYRGMSVADAAAALRVPPGTVKSRSYYALRALKLALTERGVTT